MKGSYTVRIEIGWLSAIPHNKEFSFSNKQTERIALLKAADLVIVQPWASLWEEIEDQPKRLLYKWAWPQGEWTDPAYPDIIRRLRDEVKNGSKPSYQKN